MEKVLVVPTEVISKYLGNMPFIVDNIDEIIEVVKRNHLYVDRDYAETANEYKQIIPYVILLNGSRIFLTQRLKAQTEKRLHGRYSIGLGGHINPTEESSDDSILEGMRRELFEEIGLENMPDGSCRGIINDLSTNVSNYHLGFVYCFNVSEDIEVKETDKMSGTWANDDEITEHYQRLESWSQIAWNARELWKTKIYHCTDVSHFYK